MGLAPSNAIKHIVFMIEENRSFDNVFGRFPGADGATTAKVAVGGRAVTTSLVPEPYYSWHDIGHDLGDAQRAIDGGRMDGFHRETYADVFGDKAAFQQLQPGDVPNLYAYARHFTLSDRTFAPVQTPTFPVHLHTVAAQDGGVISNVENASNAWGCDAVPSAYVRTQRAAQGLTQETPCYTFKTMADALNAAHLSWTYYAAPASDLGYIWSTLDAFKQVRQTEQWRTRVKDERSFEVDARAGRLPAFSWVTPRAGESMHPPASACPGENWIVNKINAVMQGPDWASTLLVLTWDDWGGYYDHVAPPPSPAGPFGIRVPLLIIAPYARPGRVTPTVYTFESVLKTAETIWHLPALTPADRSARDVLGELDFTRPPGRPFVLRPRSCPVPLTLVQDRALLDQALQRLLTQRLHLSTAQIETLHRTKTLSQIASERHVDPTRLLADMKVVAAAWSSGKVFLQLVTPLALNTDTYQTLTGIERLFQSRPGVRLFPTS
jgi:phospholipase C